MLDAFYVNDEPESKFLTADFRGNKQNNSSPPLLGSYLEHQTISMAETSKI